MIVTSNSLGSTKRACYLQEVTSPTSRVSSAFLRCFGLVDVVSSVVARASSRELRRRRENESFVVVARTTSFRALSRASRELRRRCENLVDSIVVARVSSRELRRRRDSLVAIARASSASRKLRRHRESLVAIARASSSLSSRDLLHESFVFPVVEGTRVRRRENISFAFERV